VKVYSTVDEIRPRRRVLSIAEAIRRDHGVGSGKSTLMNCSAVSTSDSGATCSTASTSGLDETPAEIRNAKIGSFPELHFSAHDRVENVELRSSTRTTRRLGDRLARAKDALRRRLATRAATPRSFREDNAARRDRACVITDPRSSSRRATELDTRPRGGAVDLPELNDQANVLVITHDADIASHAKRSSCCAREIVKDEPTSRCGGRASAARSERMRSVVRTANIVKWSALDPAKQDALGPDDPGIVIAWAA